MTNPSPDPIPGHGISPKPDARLEALLTPTDRKFDESLGIYSGRQLPRELRPHFYARPFSSSLPAPASVIVEPGRGSTGLADVLAWLRGVPELTASHVKDVLELAQRTGRYSDPYMRSEPESVKIFKERGDVRENRELLDLNMGRSGYEAGPTVDMCTLGGIPFHEVVTAFRRLGIKSVGIITSDAKEYGPGWEWKLYVDWHGSRV